MSQSYDIFMSYRHRPLDQEITRGSFNFLERYSLPKSIKEEGGRSIRRVFRDTEELAVSRILTSTIDDALRSAEYLVVVCSTATPESEWIDREIMTFTEMGKADRVYPLLINGSPSESFPRSLKAIPDIQDRVLDVRVQGNNADAIMKKAKRQLLRVIAEVAGCSYQRLEKEQSLRSSKRSISAAISTVAVFAAVAAVSVGLLKKAEDYRLHAVKSQNVSMTVLQELTYGLPEQLSDIPGTYSALSGILSDNAAAITQILELSGNDPSVRREIGVNYDRLSTAYRTIGRPEEALEASQRALAEFEAQDPLGADAASACNDMGGILSSIGEYDKAAEYFTRAIEIQRNIPGTEAQLAQYTANAGANLISSGKTEEGVAMLEEALSATRAENWPDAESVAIACYQYGRGLRLLMRYDEAETALQNSEEYYSAASQNTRSMRAGRIEARAELALCMVETGRYSEAAGIYSSIIPEAEELSADRENTDLLSGLAMMYNNYAVSLNLLGELDGAGEAYLSAAGIYWELLKLTGTDTHRADYALACINYADNSFTAGAYTRSEEWFEKGLSEYAAVAEDLGDYHMSTYLSYRGFYELTFKNDPAAALRDTEEAYSRYASVLSCAYYGLCCMYNGYSDAAEELFSILYENGAGGHVEQLLSTVRAKLQ